MINRLEDYTYAEIDWLTNLLTPENKAEYERVTATAKQQMLNYYTRLADHALARKHFVTYHYWMRKAEELKQ
jgi:hypothetical protein